MSIKRNLKFTVSNVFNAATSIVKVASELTLEVSDITAKSINQVMPVTKELLKVPVSAYAGWLEESGMTKAEADAKAYALLDHSLSDMVKLTSAESGKLLHKLLDEWDEEEAVKAEKA